jgi:hypothetical protein
MNVEDPPVAHAHRDVDVLQLAEHLLRRLGERRLP